MSFRIIAFVLFFIGVANSVYCQRTKEENRSNALDSKYTPPSNSPFGTSEDSQITNSVRSAFYFEPLLIPRGMASFGYARALGRSGVVVFGGAGIQMFADQLLKYNLSTGGKDIPPPDVMNPVPLDRSLRISKFKFGGAMLQAGLRIGRRDDPFDRGEFEIGWRMAKENYIFNSLDYTGYFYPMVASSHSASYLAQTFYIGYSGDFSNSKGRRVVNGLTFGIGVKRITYPTLYLDLEQSDSGTISSIKQYAINSKVTMLTVLCSWRIGRGY